MTVSVYIFTAPKNLDLNLTGSDVNDLQVLGIWLVSSCLNYISSLMSREALCLHTIDSLLVLAPDSVI